jgi:hypothetical protein
MEGFGPSLSNRTWRNKVKKIWFVLAIVFILFVSCSDMEKATYATQEKQGSMMVTANSVVTIPPVSYFQERRTIAKWAERWDKPNLPTFVYLVSFGKVLGYYVADGKPASTRSYLMPEEQTWGSNGAVIGTPDIDGTYGQNNPGIRFFTAEGVAVEWAGDGASYLYSDALLPFDVPRLNSKK